MMRTYSEMSEAATLLGRYHYLALRGKVGLETFGYERYLNQKFYASRAWKSARDEAIVRDGGCELGIADYPIFDRVLVHHMNPIEPEDLLNFNEDVLNPEYLICVSTRTHNAIHFGDETLLPQTLVERSPGDTKLW